MFLTLCDRAHKDSLVLSEPLRDLVERQDGLLCPGDLSDEVKVLRKQLEADHLQGHLDKLKALKDKMKFV